MMNVSKRQELRLKILQEQIESHNEKLAEGITLAINKSKIVSSENCSDLFAIVLNTINRFE